MRKRKLIVNPVSSGKRIKYLDLDKSLQAIITASACSLLQAKNCDRVLQAFYNSNPEFIIVYDDQQQVKSWRLTEDSKKGFTQELNRNIDLIFFEAPNASMAKV